MGILTIAGQAITTGIMIRRGVVITIRARIPEAMMAAALMAVARAVEMVVADPAAEIEREEKQAFASIPRANRHRSHDRPIPK